MGKKEKFKLSDLLKLSSMTLSEGARGIGEVKYHQQQRDLEAYAEELKRQKELAKEEEKRLKEIQRERDREIKELQTTERLLTKENKDSKKFWEKGWIPIKSTETKQREAEIHDTRQKALKLLSGDQEEPTSIKEILAEAPSLSVEEHALEKEQADQLLNFMKRTGKNYNDFTLSILPGMMEMGEGATGIVGAKDAKQWIRDKKYKYEEALDIDRNSLSARGGRFLGEMLVPIGAPAKLFKWAGKAAPLLKALTAGGAFGAVASEAQDENPLKGALYGASTGAIMHGLGSTLSKAFGKKKMAKELAAIKKDATLSKEKDILSASELMGEKATIGEIVGSEKSARRMKDYPKRLEKIEERLKEKAGELAESIPQNEKLKLYGNLEKHKANVTEEASKLYDVVKESGIATDNILDRKTIQRWLGAIKEVLPHTKGLPNLKSMGIASSKNIRELEMLLSTAPSEEKAFRNFVINNDDIIPYAEDFLKFRSKIHALQAKADSTNKQALDILDNSLEKIIEDIDVKGTLAKARKNYASVTAPVKQASLEEAITSVKFPEASKGAPKVSTIFGKHSTANSQFFEQLSTEDKKRVIGGFVEEAFEKKGKEHPSRALHEAWHILPDYIKLTDDKSVQVILRELKTIAQKNKTLSSLQQTTNASIGSRAEGRKANAFIRYSAYLASLLSGEPSFTAAVAAADLGTKGTKALLNKAHRSRTSQKNLKYFLKPELLEELIEKEQGLYSRPISRALINFNQEKKDNYME